MCVFFAALCSTSNLNTCSVQDYSGCLLCLFARLCMFVLLLLCLAECRYYYCCCCFAVSAQNQASLIIWINTIAILLTLWFWFPSPVKHAICAQTGFVKEFRCKTENEIKDKNATAATATSTAPSAQHPGKNIHFTLMCSVLKSFGAITLIVCCSPSSVIWEWIICVFLHFLRMVKVFKLQTHSSHPSFSQNFRFLKLSRMVSVSCYDSFICLNYALFST